MSSVVKLITFGWKEVCTVNLKFRPKKPALETKQIKYFQGMIVEIQPNTTHSTLQTAPRGVTVRRVSMNKASKRCTPVWTMTSLGIHFQRQVRIGSFQFWIDQNKNTRILTTIKSVYATNWYFIHIEFKLTDKYIPHLIYSNKQKNPLYLIVEH